MNCLLNTFDRYETIWTCMDMMPTIVKALDTAHHVWKLRGVQSRPLLSLLMKFDHGKHLEEASRERIASDVAAFTLVFFLLSTTPLNLSDRACRRYNLLANKLTLFLVSFPRFCFWPVTLTQMPLLFLQTGYGSNIAHPWIGLGRCGITLLQACDKFQV